MQPLKVDVAEILESAGAVLELDAEAVFDELHVGDETFVACGPALVSVILANVGSGVVASGTVTARVSATCARCLRAFETTIAGEIEGFYTNRTEDSTDDAEPIGMDKSVDLAPAVNAALMVEAPFAPLHDPECKGLCAACGVDLNEESCECDSETDESHPFAGLKNLFGEDADA